MRELWLNMERVVACKGTEVIQRQGQLGWISKAAAASGSISSGSLLPRSTKIRLWNQRKGRKKQVIKSLQIQIYCVTVRQPRCQTKDKSKSSSGKTSFTIYPAWNYVWLTDKLNKLEKFPEFPRCFQLHFDSRSYSKLNENLSSTVICMRSTNLILCLPFTLNKICTTKSFHIKVIH